MSTFSLSTSTEFLAIDNSRRQLSLGLLAHVEHTPTQQQISVIHRNLLTILATLPPAIRCTPVDAERQDRRGSFGSSPLSGPICRSPPPLRSSRLVRTEFSPVLIYMRAARTHGLLPSYCKSPCSVERLYSGLLSPEPYHFSSQLMFWQGTVLFRYKIERPSGRHNDTPK